MDPECVETSWMVCSEEEARQRAYRVVVVPECVWSLDEEDDVGGEPVKMLMLTLVKPPLTEEEIKWKKGEGQKWHCRLMSLSQSHQFQV